MQLARQLHARKTLALVLTLQAMRDGEQAETEGRDALCHWRRNVLQGEAFRHWNTTCMVTDAADQSAACNMRDVLMHAWCWGHYNSEWQSLHNL